MELFEKIRVILNTIRRIKEDTQETRFLMGTLLSKTVNTLTSIKEAEFKVSSQFGDDGIIQFLINRFPISIDKFIEFGVENYEEANTRFLLIHNNWKGLVIDGSHKNIEYIKHDPIYWRQELTAVPAFITVDNINQLFLENNFDGKVGILSIDIDGNDYWIWKAITVTDADIVIAEYNSLFGYERAISVPYTPNFNRTAAHYSNLYFGASLPALYDLGVERGYGFIGCNKAGNNAYFIKNELLDGFPTLSIKDGFVDARFRESRDPQGKLTFLNVVDRRKQIAGLPVINTRTGLLEVL